MTIQTVVVKCFMHRQEQVIADRVLVEYLDVEPPGPLSIFNDWMRINAPVLLRSLIRADGARVTVIATDESGVILLGIRRITSEMQLALNLEDKREHLFECR